MAAKSDAKALAKFTIVDEDEGFRLHIEDDSGGKLELTATAEQLDLIAETIDDLLGGDDAVDALEDDDEAGEDGED